MVVFRIFVPHRDIYATVSRRSRSLQMCVLWTNVVKERLFLEELLAEVNKLPAEDFITFFLQQRKHFIERKINSLCFKKEAPTSD